MATRTFLCALALSTIAAPACTQTTVTTYVRYTFQDQVAYGVLEGDQIHQLSDAPFSGGTRTGETVFGEVSIPRSRADEASTPQKYSS